MMDRSIGLNKRWNTLVKNTKEFLFCCSFSTNMVLLQNGGSVTTTSPQNTALAQAVYHEKTTVLLKSAI
jgi:hypothetical protein